MSAVGLVLGGGGITGAAFEMATLMAIELATGWNCNDSDVVVGTSSGAFVAALVRHNRLDLDSLVLPDDGRTEVALRIKERTYRSRPGVHLGKWMRHGLLPGMRRPGLTLLLGSPAPYDTTGLGDWVREELGTEAEGWPDRPTVIVAFDASTRRRTAFGTTNAPDIGLADAVCASTAIPLVFRPHIHDGRPYVDGGVASGTHADLVLGNVRPLDLVLVIAPMAAEEERRGALPHERLFDRVGRRSLDEETALIKREWPEAEVLVIRPTPQVLASMRPNPMDPDLAVPAFVRTLIGMKKCLGETATWSILERHLGAAARVHQST
ncbi:MAG TPA: patatin-like phospholipase family protein [Acidimicrobiia bacterium]|nr:patatin-like phospholipase family protein [Acidimicrobiia bacterium]